MLNLKLIRCLKFNDRLYVHFLRNVDISYITNEKSRNLITVNLHVSGSYRKYDTFETLSSADNRALLDKLGEYGLSDTQFMGTLLVNHDTGALIYIPDVYIKTDDSIEMPTS